MLEFLGKHVFDLYIILLLGFQASMIFPALSWWPHPITWFRSLAPTEKFTLFVAAFTGLLTLVTAVQVWAFIQSERAFLAVDIQQFRGGLTANKELSIVTKIKNGGKSTAFIEKMHITNSFKKSTEKLADEPKYYPGNDITPSPVLPSVDITIIDRITGLKGEPLMLTQPNVNAINVDEGKLYVFGFVTYHDDFSPIFGSRTTGFCFEYDPHSTDPSITFYTCIERAYTYSR